MARLSDSTLRTVRFYEEAGLLRPLERSNGRYRLFPQSELTRLRLVADLRAAGFSVQEIRDLLEFAGRFQDGASAASALGEELRSRIEALNARVALLQRVASELERARAALRACESCSEDGKRFPSGCRDCEPLRNCPTICALWDVSG